MSAAARIIAQIGNRIEAADGLCAFVDFEGALAGSGEGLPGRLDAGVVETLRLIASQRSSSLTVASLRPVRDIFERIALDEIVYAGNGGLEVYGRAVRYTDSVAAARQGALRRLCGRLAARLRLYPGAVVECHGLAASIRYESAARRHLASIEDLVRRAAAWEQGCFQFTRQRRAFGIAPRTGWHRGMAFRWIRNRCGGKRALPVLVGCGPALDEAANALPGAVTVHVGLSAAARPRRVEYCLPGSMAVHEFLLWLAIHGARRRRPGGS